MIPYKVERVPKMKQINLLNTLTVGMAMMFGVALYSSSSFAANAQTVNASNLQSTVNVLQKQIQGVANSVPKALAKQNITTQKEIKTMQVQVQQQLKHLQKEVQQVQAEMTREVGTVQKEVRQIELTR